MGVQLRLLDDKDTDKTSLHASNKVDTEARLTNGHRACNRAALYQAQYSSPRLLHQPPGEAETRHVSWWMRVPLRPRAKMQWSQTATGRATHLSRYASISAPSTAERILHLTMSSISSQTALGTFLSPILPSVEEDASGRWAGDGANHISSNFSAPSNGPWSWVGVV